MAASATRDPAVEPIAGRESPYSIGSADIRVGHRGRVEPAAPVHLVGNDHLTACTGTRPAYLFPSRAEPAADQLCEDCLAAVAATLPRPRRAARARLGA